MSLWNKINAPRGAGANKLLRIVVGGVFLNEGVFKFMYPAAPAAGRFAKIGIPHPDFFGPFVATAETVCGAILILGLLTRPAAFAMFIDISVAVLCTKIFVLLGHGFFGFSLMESPHYGLLSMEHEVRTDFTMWFGLLFLLVAGPGRCSVDALIHHN